MVINLCFCLLLVNRLHKTYRESSPIEEGSSPKKLKFATMQSAYTSETGAGVSEYCLSKAVSKAFPQTTTKRRGKKRVTYIHGIQANEPTASDTIQPTRLGGEDTQESLDTREEEEEDITEEAHTDMKALQHLNQQLQEKVLALEHKITALEKQGRNKCDTDELDSQMYAVMHRGTWTASGPDTRENFEHFSLDAVTLELKTHAPPLYELFMKLGDVRRTAADDDDATTIQTLKAITLLCALLNAHSNRVKGFQLLTSLMLIARAISRQVCMCNTTETYM